MGCDCRKLQEYLFGNNKKMISVVITTYNEAEKIKGCLESLKGFAGELVVVDLGSQDKTEEVVKKFKAKLFKHELVPYVELVRNYAISKASADWILILDPDERITPALAGKLKRVAEAGEYVAVNIPRKNIFFGRWIAHTNWWPDKHIRFFRKGKLKWSEKIHSYPTIDGKILELPNDEALAIRHCGYQNISEFIDRQLRYSSIEAEYRFKNGVRFSWRLFVWMPLREFLVRFLKHAGFLDGFYGFVLTYLMMVYQMIVMVKVWELEKNEK